MLRAGVPASAGAVARTPRHSGTELATDSGLCRARPPGRPPKWPRGNDRRPRRDVSTAWLCLQVARGSRIGVKSARVVSGRLLRGSDRRHAGGGRGAGGRVALRSAARGDGAAVGTAGAPRATASRRTARGVSGAGRVDGHVIGASETGLVKLGEVPESALAPREAAPSSPPAARRAGDEAAGRAGVPTARRAGDPAEDADVP